MNLGIQELVLILVIALVIFGPKKLPEIGKAFGRTVSEVRSAITETETAKTENKPLQITEKTEKHTSEKQS